MRIRPLFLLPVVAAIAAAPLVPSAVRWLAPTAPPRAAQPSQAPAAPDGSTSGAFGGPRSRSYETWTPTGTPDAAALERAYTASTAAAVRVNIGASGLGSGFFLTGDGLVLTAAHVALGESGAGLSVTTDDGQSHPARMIGYDEARDLAVLRVEGGGFSHLDLAASPPAVGDGVVAIGNSRGAFDGARAGRVTALDASLDATFPSGLVASSMPLAPGDSGGPVINERGEVVGVSTAISLAGGQFSSYFVPVTATSRVVRDLVAGARRGVPVIGVSVASASGYTGGQGALVTGVTGGLGAAQAGIREPGTRQFLDDQGRAGQQVVSADVIVAVDGRPVRGPADLVAYLRARSAGDRVTLRVQRGDGTVEVSVTLSDRRTV